jgi:hypothetical protein
MEPKKERSILSYMGSLYENYSNYGKGRDIFEIMIYRQAMGGNRGIHIITP